MKKLCICACAAAILWIQPVCAKETARPNKDTHNEHKPSKVAQESAFVDICVFIAPKQQQFALTKIPSSPTSEKKASFDKMQKPHHLFQKIGQAITFDNKKWSSISALAAELRKIQEIYVLTSPLCLCKGKEPIKLVLNESFSGRKTQFTLKISPLVINNLVKLHVDSKYDVQFRKGGLKAHKKGFAQLKDRDITVFATDFKRKPIKGDATVQNPETYKLVVLIQKLPNPVKE